MGFSDRLTALLGDGTPDAQTIDDDGFSVFSNSYEIDRVEPPDDDLETYWRQYETCPLVRIPVRMYAEDVTEPGYRVEADDEQLAQELEQWLDEAALHAGEADHNFGEILFDAIVQKEVRGTALTEVVPKAENPEEIWGFTLINASTVSAYTYENQSILIRPDDTEQADVRLTPTGEAAAYGQWDDTALAGPFDEDAIYLSQNDVVKYTQDADTGDIFGTSSIEPISDHVSELQQMLNDTAQAVHSKGHPHWIFKLGEPNGDVTNPRAGIWPDDEMQSYRNSHKEGNWSAGQKDFVPGDVDVETISGEVADIDYLVDWYVEQIVSALPTPKFKLGHSDSVNRDVTKTQQTQYERKLQAERRSLERAFQGVIRRKARELGYGDALAGSVELRIEQPRDENPLTSDDFDAGEFKELAQGVKALAPGGQADRVVSPDEVREMLGLPSQDDGEAEEMDDFDEMDEHVQEQFEELYGEPLVHDSEPDGELEAEQAAD